MEFILRMLISACAIFGVAYLTGGKLLGEMEFWPTAAYAAFVLAIVNAFIKPIVKALLLPVTFLTLGLFALVINAGMLWLVAQVVPGFTLVGFLETIIAALIIAVVSSIGGALVKKRD